MARFKFRMAMLLKLREAARDEAAPSWARPIGPTMCLRKT